MNRCVCSVVALLLAGVLAVGCTPQTGEEGGASTPGAPPAKPAPPPLPEVESASKATDVKLTIVEPRDGEVYETEDGTLKVKLELENYEIAEGGQHIHVILDNESYQAHYNVNEPCVFENVEYGWHCVRAFPSRPWHESIKPQYAPEAFQLVQFFVVPQSPVDFSPKSPLLTYSRPKGVYEGRDAERILLDFQVLNCELSEDGYRVRYQVVPAGEEKEEEKAVISEKAADEESGKGEKTAGEEAGKVQEEGPGKKEASQEESQNEETSGKEKPDGWTYIASWPPAPGENLHVIKGLASGDWTVILELVDKNDELAGANSWNHTERTITVKK